MGLEPTTNGLQGNVVLPAFGTKLKGRQEVLRGLGIIVIDVLPAGIRPIKYGVGFEPTSCSQSLGSWTVPTVLPYIEILTKIDERVLLCYHYTIPAKAGSRIRTDASPSVEDVLPSGIQDQI